MMRVKIPSCLLRLESKWNGNGMIKVIQRISQNETVVLGVVIRNLITVNTEVLIISWKDKNQSNNGIIKTV